MNVFSLRSEELKDFFIKNNEKGYRAEQLFSWIYQKKVISFSEMSNFSLSFRGFLESKLDILTIELVKKQTSKDEETVKFLFSLSDGQYIESVLIKSKNRNTVCVSTQVGCKMFCSFCASGKRGFFRDLHADEIVQQVYFINMVLSEVDERVSNVVFMGMGEPLSNYSNVTQSIKILNDPLTLNISQRKISISTVGITDKIYQLIKDDVKVNLVFSLHASNQSLREKIIPAAKKYHMNDILKALDEYFFKTKREVTFEYILIEGLNDTNRCLEELVNLLGKGYYKLNLIPYNPVDGFCFRKPKSIVIEKFMKKLTDRNIKVTRRYTKGNDIDAACGQLALKEVIN